jgi:hypothetical protein
LKKAQLAAHLEQSLAERAPYEDLVAHNIVSDSKTAPALQGAQKRLEKERIGDSLSSHLSERPTAEALRDQRILFDGGDNIGTQGTDAGKGIIDDDAQNNNSQGEVDDVFVA